jgi:hypothetical protein
LARKNRSLTVETNRAVAGSHRQREASAVQLPAQARFAARPGDGHRQLGGNAAVAGVDVEVGGEIRSQPQPHAAVAGLDAPARRHLRAGLHFRFDAPFVGAQVELIEAAAHGNPAVAGPGVERAVQRLGADASVAGHQPGIAVQALHQDSSVAGMDFRRRFARRPHFHPHRVVAGAPMAAGDANFQFDAIGDLPVRHPDLVRTDLPALGDHANLDRAGCAGPHLDRGVIRVHPQSGLAGYGEFLGPIGCGRQAGRREHKEQHSSAHSSSWEDTAPQPERFRRENRGQTELSPGGQLRLSPVFPR